MSKQACTHVQDTTMSFDSMFYLPFQTKLQKYVDDNFKMEDEFEVGVVFCLTFCCCCLIWLIITLVLGVCGAVLYNPFSLVSTINIVQIHRPSVVLLGLSSDVNNIVRFTVNGPDFFSISVHTLNDCSSDDSFESIEVNETITVRFNFPTEKTKSLTEWYFLENITLSVTVTTEVLPKLPS